MPIILDIALNLRFYNKNEKQLDFDRIYLL